MNKLSKRAIASRANGKLSQGPKSPETKLRSSNNSVRHGLLANCVLIKDESRESFTLLLDQHLEKLNPADQVEYGMVEEMAATIWRMRRLWAIETNLLTDGVAKRSEPNPMSRLSGAFSDLSRGTELHLIDRYEARLNRMYHRALKNFHLLRQFSDSDDQPDTGPRPEANDENTVSAENPGNARAPRAVFTPGEHPAPQHPNESTDEEILTCDDESTVDASLSSEDSSSEQPASESNLEQLATSEADLTLLSQGPNVPTPQSPIVPPPTHSKIHELPNEPRSPQPPTESAHYPTTSNPAPDPPFDCYDIIDPVTGRLRDAA